APDGRDGNGARPAADHEGQRRADAAGVLRPGSRGPGHAGTVAPHAPAGGRVPRRGSLDAQVEVVPGVDARPVPEPQAAERLIDSVDVRAHGREGLGLLVREVSAWAVGRGD